MGCWDRKSSEWLTVEKGGQRQVGNTVVDKAEEAELLDKTEEFHSSIICVDAHMLLSKTIRLSSKNHHAMRVYEVR